MICGWDKTGPALFYVDSDGTRMKGDLFSVGSGSTFAYGVLDQGYSWDLSDEDAQELGRRSIYAAAHRDAFSGNTINVYHVREEGWERFDTVDVNELVRPLIHSTSLLILTRLLPTALRSFSILPLFVDRCADFVCAICRTEDTDTTFESKRRSSPRRLPLWKSAPERTYFAIRCFSISFLPPRTSQGSREG